MGPNDNEPVSLGRNYEYLAMLLGNLVSDIPKVMFVYTTLLEYYKTDNENFKDQKLKLERSLQSVEYKESAYLDWKKDAGTLSKYEKNLVELLKNQLVDTNEITSRMRAHIATLTKRPAKRTVYLRIHDVLGIVDGKHTDYRLLRNEIVSVTMQGQAYEFINRLHFLGKNNETYYVDYLTNYPVLDYTGRQIIDQLVTKDVFKDIKYKIIAS